MTELDLQAMRSEYTREGLRRADLKESPFEQFAFWFEQACKTGVREPNAMSVATATATGRPSLRTVLLKNFDDRGFVFFTNYESRKAREIIENPNVALLFPWLALERQVIVTGTAEKVSADESLKYFVSRPLESQLGAWASPQSRPIPSREFLQAEITKVREKFANGKLPLPSFWGGFRVVPKEIEFWQGGPGRVHDRFIYTLQTDASWKIDRLAP
jgi:pyridoxamine 5'-phosphate oxidase